MKKMLVIHYEIETEDYEDLMESDELTLDEAINQLMDDGELELNELPIHKWEIIDEATQATKQLP